MTARRCSLCGLSFPMEPRWTHCAHCGEPTDVITNAKPNITPEDATSRLRHREFEEYMEAKK